MTAIIRLLFEITEVVDLISSIISSELHKSISQLHVTSTSTSSAMNYDSLHFLHSYDSLRKVLTFSIARIVGNDVGNHLLFRVIHCNNAKYWILINSS